MVIDLSIVFQIRFYDFASAHPMFATCEPCASHPIQGRLKLAEVLTPQNDTAQGLQHIHGLVETQITRTAGSCNFRRIQSDTQLFEFLHEGFFAL